MERWSAVRARRARDRGRDLLGILTGHATPSARLSRRGRHRINPKLRAVTQIRRCAVTPARRPSGPGAAHSSSFAASGPPAPPCPGWPPPRRPPPGPAPRRSSRVEAPDELLGHRAQEDGACPRGRRADDHHRAAVLVAQFGRQAASPSPRGRAPAPPPASRVRRGRASPLRCRRRSSAGALSSSISFCCARWCSSVFSTRAGTSPRRVERLRHAPQPAVDSRAAATRAHARHRLHAAR